MKIESLIPPKKEIRFDAYLSSSDSELLRSALREYSGETSLEIGAGNAGNLIELAKRFRMVAGTDLVKPASRMSDEPRNADFVLADGASCFRDGVFDLVAFNPPYVPTGGIEDVAVDGGKGGVEVSLGFLKDALRVVKTSGKIVFIVSSENPVNVLEEECRKKGFLLVPLSTRKLFYETLFVYVAERLGRPS
jgi:release factor glutamine methyltransferase